MSKKILKVALIGYGFMGNAHSAAYTQAQKIFDLPVEFDMKYIVGRDKARCNKIKNKWGWNKCLTDWREAISNKNIDIIDIVTPNYLHCDIAIAAANNKKHVLCEKPLGINVDECENMLKAVEKNKVLHMIWHIYRKLPAIRLAKKFIEESRLGKVYHVRCHFLHGWQVDPDVPLHWSHIKRMSGSGVHAGLNSHLIDMSRYLVGEIVQVCGIMKTYIKDRVDIDGKRQKVDVDDACSFLAHFDNGAIGVFEASRVATGRITKNYIEINGSDGALYWDFEDMNSLYFYDNRNKIDRRGFKRIEAVSGCHPYMEEHWSKNHAVGYSQTFINALSDFAISYSKGEIPEPNFYDGLRNQEVLDAVIQSADNKQWIQIKD